MTFLSILALGFFLGMRHATDSDHVVAVTTIVSRQCKIGSAALTGIFWGIGHSITLLVVGGAIILFGIVIPERLGMSLEFCVALMLILLGWLNLRPFKRSVAGVASIDHSVHEHVHQHGDYIHVMRMHMLPANMGIRKRKCRQRAWIDNLAARSFIGCFGRSSSASSMAWPARRR